MAGGPTYSIVTSNATDPLAPVRTLEPFCSSRRLVVRITPGLGARDDARNLPLHLRFTVERAEHPVISANVKWGLEPARATPVQFEADAGSYLVRPNVGVEFIGGTGEWHVEVLQAEEVWLRPQRFWLTRVAVDGGAVRGLDNHVEFRGLSGSWSYNTVGANLAAGFVVPLAVPIVAVAPPQAYQTGLEL
jgi:hypothetical protein